ncbi:MAG TPA: DUF1080 domain-containing protein [Planctomycetaceae bacterium]|nr:DUF1080 domain-containing protein [Planctomycetaceae bacterium]
MRRGLMRVAWVCTLICATGRLFAADADRPSSEVPIPPLSRDEIEQGWISLFDGRTLFGWQPNSDMNWSVRDGVIRADRGKPGLLLTTFELADYEFRCDYRLEKGGNSGLFIRTPFSPKNPAKDCYELNMCDSHPAFPTGSIVGRKKANGTLRGEGAWMTMFARVEGNRIIARLDGQPVIDFTDDSPNRLRVGRIGLQMNGGAVEFRNVCLRPLSTKTIFDGHDLAGWYLVPGSKTRFEVVDSTIHASGGPGILETDSTWADFCLQVDARTNGTGLNSGVFFRAMRGTAKEPSNGYELQIQNGFKRGDRSDPVDAGTGAIYRRTKARWVIPDDRVWFTATLIANQTHVSAWVNGVQVTDWTDTRPSNPNPRRGSRLAAGHLSLQGHDRTTDLNFRRIRVAEIPSQ